MKYTLTIPRFFGKDRQYVSMDGLNWLHLNKPVSENLKWRLHAMWLESISK